MGPGADRSDGLDVSLDEAVWRDIQVDVAFVRVVVEIEVLTAASLRRGRWTTAAAPVDR